MTSILGISILIKAVITAIIVSVSSRTAEMFGPFWGALIASLPVSVGPAYIFLAMEHETDFIAASALTSFAANGATGIFLIVYARSAGLRIWFGLGAAITAWVLSCLLISQVSWTPLTALSLNLIVFGMGFYFTTDLMRKRSIANNSKKTNWYDLPLRACAVGMFVALLVTFSSNMGAGVTGLVSVFPVSLLCTIIISRPAIGVVSTAELAATALRAMLGFGFALLILHIALKNTNITLSLLIAFFVSMLWSIGLFIHRRRVNYKEA